MRLTKEFFTRDAVTVARELVGKFLVRETEGGILALRIDETEVYGGEADTACHAHRGRTPRTEPLYGEGGTLYVYLCYGLHNLLNVVTGAAGDPQCVLIRACETPFDGPAKLTKRLMIDRSFNALDVTNTPGLWIEDRGGAAAWEALPRVGIGYASQEDQARRWRYKRIAEAKEECVVHVPGAEHI